VVAMANVRRVEGFSEAIVGPVEDARVYALDFYPARALAVAVTGRQLKEAGLSDGADSVPATAVIEADVDLDASDLVLGSTVDNLRFKGWLPGLDDKFSLGGATDVSAN